MHKKVLVVDDDYTVRSTLRSLIVYGGIGKVQVTLAGSGQDAWREFQVIRHDVVVTDLDMEHPLAGLELAKKIKAVSPATQVIMTTGAVDIELGKIQKVVDLFMFKPYDGDDLVEKIRELLGGH